MIAITTDVALIPLIGIGNVACVSLALTVIKCHSNQLGYCDASERMLINLHKIDYDL